MLTVHEVDCFGSFLSPVVISLSPLFNSSHVAAPIKADVTHQGGWTEEFATRFNLGAWRTSGLVNICENEAENELDHRGIKWSK